MTTTTTTTNPQMTSEYPPPYIPTTTDQIDELPAYSNSIHLVTLCRRKLEYTAPNVPARKGSRAWDFYWLVLSGTALNLYQPKRSEVKAHIKHETETRAVRIKEHKRAIAARKKDARKKDAASGPNTLYAHHADSHTPTSHSSPSLSSLPSPVHKLPFDVLESLNTPAAPPAPLELAPLVPGGKPYLDNETAPDFSTHKLVKQYAMNGATGVHVYDYLLRRYFVLRICADGQQFMIQLNSHPETLEWLEAIGVAACLSLDLDERPMVEPPRYPRRRRHPTDLSTEDQLENTSVQRAEIPQLE